MKKFPEYLEKNQNQIAVIIGLLALIVGILSIPALAEWNRERSQRVRYNDAKAAADAESWEKVNQILGPSFEVYIENREALDLYFESRLETGQWDECQRIIRWSESAGHGDPRVEYWRQRLWEATGWMDVRQAILTARDERQWDEVLSLIEGRADENLEDLEPHLAHVRAAFEKDRLTEARRKTDRLEILHPKEKDVRYWKETLSQSKEWHVLRRQAMVAAGDEDWWQVFSILHPRIGDHLDDLDAADVYLRAAVETEHLREGHEVADRIFKLHPEAAQIQFWKGALYVSEERARDGIPLLKRALPRVKEKSPEVYMYLGLAYFQLGQGPQGCEAFRSYLVAGENIDYKAEVRKIVGAQCA